MDKPKITSYTPSPLELERGYTRLGSPEFYEKATKPSVKKTIESDIQEYGFSIAWRVQQLNGVSRQAVHEMIKRNEDKWAKLRVWRYYNNEWVDWIIYPREQKPSHIKNLIYEQYGYIIA